MGIAVIIGTILLVWLADMKGKLTFCAITYRRANVFLCR